MTYAVTINNHFEVYVEHTTLLTTARDYVLTQLVNCYDFTIRSALAKLTTNTEACPIVRKILSDIARTVTFTKGET